MRAERGLRWVGAGVAALVAPGCVVAASSGTLQTPELTGGDAVSQGEVMVEREALVVGTAIDFRYLRIVSSIELLNRELSLNTESDQVAVPEPESTYLERRWVRLDVPVLSAWDFQSSGPGYPGLLEHRQTLDLWGRVGLINIRDEFEGFMGGALTYYHTGLFAFSLTVDHWTEPASVSALNTFGSLTPFEGTADGWVLGFEITLFAGEYGLDLIKLLLDYDAKARAQFPARAGAASEGAPPKAAW